MIVDMPKRPDGKRRQKWHGAFGSRREAARARAIIVKGTGRGGPKGRDVTLSSWILDSWLPTTAGRVRPSTFHSYCRNLELHVLPILGSRPVAEVTPPELTALYGRLLNSGGERGPLSPTTVHNIHLTIHKALTDAVDAGLVPHNAAERAKPPRRRTGGVQESQVWEARQLARFLEHVKGNPLEAIWRLAALTGMRRGEILGLRWRDIDFDAARLSVRTTRLAVDYQVIESRPKGGSARVIDLDAETVDQLRVHRLRQLQVEAECTSGTLDDFVAVAPGEELIHPDAFSRLFRQLVKSSQLPLIRLHDLRHTHGSQGLAAGIPVKVISERLGHQSPAFTLATYAHVLPGMQAEAAARIAMLVDRERT